MGIIPLSRYPIREGFFLVGKTFFFHVLLCYGMTSSFSSDLDTLILLLRIVLVAVRSVVGISFRD